MRRRQSIDLGFHVPAAVFVGNLTASTNSAPNVSRGECGYCRCGPSGALSVVSWRRPHPSSDSVITSYGTPAPIETIAVPRSLSGLSGGSSTLQAH